QLGDGLGARLVALQAEQVHLVVLGGRADQRQAAQLAALVGRQRHVGGEVENLHAAAACSYTASVSRAARSQEKLAARARPRSTSTARKRGLPSTQPRPCATSFGSSGWTITPASA